VQGDVESGTLIDELSMRILEEEVLQPEDVTSLLSIKLVLKYAQLREVESMRAIARAHQNRNLAEFEKALRDYQKGK
jgi:26S proteasome regulatory subunit N6